MKKILIRIFAVVLVVCFVGTLFVGCAKDEKVTETKEKINPVVLARVSELKTQLENNLEVQTYKNTFPIYKELIELQPGEIQWYEGLADAYRAMNKTRKYIDMCEEMITLFPEDKTGHLKLIKYYAAKEREKDVYEIFDAAPETVQNDPEFLSYYKKFEWVYDFIDRSYQNIGTFSGNRYVMELRGQYGYRNAAVRSGISAKFSIARPFVDDLAAVNQSGEWFFIDNAGDRVLATKEKLEDLYSFSEGYAVAKINGQYGYIDPTFKKYSFKYEDATLLSNGIAAVKMDGKWGLINSEFKLIVPCVYDDVVRDDANICSRGKVVFMKADGVYYLLNLKGEKVTSTAFDDAKPFYSDCAAVKKDGQWGFINSNGNTVIAFQYEGASSFGSGIAAVQQDGQWGCINTEGKVILPFEYDYTMSTSDNGVVIAKINNKYRFVKFLKFE